LSEKNGSVNEDFIYFCEIFFKCIIGTKSFNRGWKDGVAISKIATILDEALGLLLIENSEARWMAEFAKKEKGEKVIRKDLPPSVYTTSGGQSEKRGTKGFTMQYGGWSYGGIVCFNLLFDMVTEDRKLNGAIFDEIVTARIAGAKSIQTEMDEPKCFVRASNELGLGKKKDEVPEEITTALDSVSV